MPYTAPDADELKLRYPAFSAVADDVIEYWISDAQLIVTDSWIENDYSPAILTLAAHNMARQGLGAAAAGAAEGLTGVTSFRSGSFSISMSEEAVRQQAKGGYASTPYGQDFAIYLRRNRGGPRVTVGCRW